MEATKKRLSSIADLIKESFPDGNDLKNFQGISKEFILDSLKRSEQALELLIPYNHHFDVIVLKRELAEVFDKLNRILDEKFVKIKPNDFNAFLKNVTRIRALITQTYISVVNEPPVRTEEQIVKANQELDQLNSTIETVKKIGPELLQLKETGIEKISAEVGSVSTKKGIAFSEIESLQTQLKSIGETTLKDINYTEQEVKKIKNSADKIYADLETKQRIAVENEEKTTAFLLETEKHKVAIEQVNNNVAKWSSGISTIEKEIKEKESHYNELLKKSSELYNVIEATNAKISGVKDQEGNLSKGYIHQAEDLIQKIQNFLKEQQTKYDAQFDEIKGLLPGATSVGLAKAYYEQRVGYKRTIKTWSTIFILTISIMTALSLVLLYDQLEAKGTLNLNGAFISLLKDLPFFIPTIWMAAFASKQHSQAKRMQQEYAFKEANAKSFEGLKLQIEKLMKDKSADKELLAQLVAQLVLITGQNPSETLDSKSHNDSPPIFRLVEELLSRNKKAKQDATSSGPS